MHIDDNRHLANNLTKLYLEPVQRVQCFTTLWCGYFFLLW